MRPPLVYVAGPYAAPDPVLNTRRAFQAGLEVYESTGFPVVVPHLTLLGHAMFPRDIDFWYEFDLVVLRRCDVLLRLPGESTGADREVAEAHARGIPVVRWMENRRHLNDLLALAEAFT
jgi:hypothetical protein